MKRARSKKVFIGSSVEGIPVMEALHAQFEFDDDIKTYPWTLINFAISKTPLDSLEDFLESHDYAVLIFTPDDNVSKRDETKSAPRDNVLFEFGLFLGRLGRERTFVVRPRGRDLHIPTDLKGLTPAEYEPSDNPDDLKVNLSHTAGRIRAAIRKNEDKRLREAGASFRQSMNEIRSDLAAAQTATERMDVVLGGLRGLLQDKSVIMQLSLDDILRDVILLSACFLDFLDSAQLANHQHANLSEVWVYAPKPLELHVSHKKLREQVGDNIRSGVGYTYFVDSDAGVERIKRLVDQMAKDNRKQSDSACFRKQVRIVRLEPEFFLTYYTVHISNGSVVEVIQSVLTKQRNDILISLPKARAKTVHRLITRLLRKCVVSNVNGVDVLTLKKRGKSA
jgi:hypothetical protein